MKKCLDRGEQKKEEMKVETELVDEVKSEKKKEVADTIADFIINISVVKEGGVKKLVCSSLMWFKNSFYSMMHAKFVQ